MRSLDSDSLAALDIGRFHARNGFTVAMPAGTFALWDDVYDITTGGVTYSKGAGAFTISAHGSAGDLAARSIDIVLSGIDSRIAAQVVQQPWHQRAVTVTRFLMAADTPTVILPKVWFVGFLDTLDWAEKPDGTSDIVARCEDHNRDLNRKGSRTRSASDHRQLAPGDAFFDAVTAAVTQQVTWGRGGPQTVPSAPARRKFLGIF